MKIILFRYIGSILDPKSTKGIDKIVTEVNEEYNKVVDEYTDKIKIMSDADGALLFFVEKKVNSSDMDAINISDAFNKMYFIINKIKEKEND